MRCLIRGKIRRGLRKILCLCVSFCFVFVSPCFGFVVKIKPLFEEMALLSGDYNITEEDVVVGRSRFEELCCILSID